MRKTDAELDMMLFLQIQERAKQEAQKANIQQAADRIHRARNDMGIPLQTGERHICLHEKCAPLSEAMCIARKLLPAHEPIINPNVFLCRRWRVHHCTPSDCFMVGVCTISAIERTKLYQRGKEQPWAKPDHGAKKSKIDKITKVLTYVRNPKKRGAFQQLPCEEEGEGDENDAIPEESEESEEKETDEDEEEHETAPKKVSQATSALKKRKVAKRTVTLHRGVETGAKDSFRNIVMRLLFDQGPRKRANAMRIRRYQDSYVKLAAAEKARMVKAGRMPNVCTIRANVDAQLIRPRLYATLNAKEHMERYVNRLMVAWNVACEVEWVATYGKSLHHTSFAIGLLNLMCNGSAINSGLGYALVSRDFFLSLHMPRASDLPMFKIKEDCSRASKAIHNLLEWIVKKDKAAEFRDALLVS